MDLFVGLPDRADELVEVALRLHAWGGEPRKQLIQVAVAHPGGRLLAEVLLQIINRSDEGRRLRAVKVLAGCLSKPSSENLLYTNDVRVLVEILMRELPCHAGDATVFNLYMDCFAVLCFRCPAAKIHRRLELTQVLEDIRDDDRNPNLVREKCQEILQEIISPSEQ